MRAVAWLAGVVAALALLLAAAHCGVDVELGVDPASDAAAADRDAGAGADGDAGS